ncbi:MAG: polysaccharide biosynthesis/export family protein [Thermoanaerobaculia bacterium]
MTPSSRRMGGFAFSLIALAAVMLLAAPGLAQDAPDVDSVEYTLGPKDLVDVKVLEIPELNVERRVTDTGTIELPLVGAFAVAGMTPLEAAERLSQVLMSKYVNRANVTFVVKEFANKPLSIVGAVARPGSLNVSGRYTLLQAISAAGGLTSLAGKKIYVMRTSDSGASDILEIRTDDLLRSSSTKWNIPLRPSDVVNIPAKTTVKVFCLGEVKAPGAMEFDSDDRLTLLTVIAKAGGLTDRASKRIRISRRGVTGQDTETEIDYKAVLAGRINDPQLNADDVVIVKQAFF